MKTKKAFTIVELTLAMGFIGTMLFGIASLMMQIMSIYQKGLTMRSINSTGREIVSDLTRTINASRVDVDVNPAQDDEITLNDLNNARRQYYYQTEKDKKQLGGVFCTGNYSYVWNTADNIREYATVGNGFVADGEFIYNNSGAKIRAMNNAKSGKYILEVLDNKNDKNPHHFILPRFARVRDDERTLCEKPADGTTRTSFNLTSQNSEINLAKLENFKIKQDDVVELIKENENGIALYNFTILPATQNSTTKQIFYSGMFILATIRGGVNIKSNGEFCQGSNKYSDSEGDQYGVADSEFTSNDFDYCAVNKFNFSTRATGQSSNIKQHGL